jgi:hypothetical protein
MPALTTSSLGTNNPAYCILLALACYFLWYLHLAGGRVGCVYMYASNNSNDALKQFNQTFSHNFLKLLKIPEFQEALEDPSKCGVYSLHKYPTTYAKQAAICIQEYIMDIHGWWKPNQGPCLILKDGTGVDNGFIHEHVIPEF